MYKACHKGDRSLFRPIHITSQSDDSTPPSYLLLQSLQPIAFSTASMGPNVQTVIRSDQVYHKVKYMHSLYALSKSARCTVTT